MKYHIIILIMCSILAGCAEDYIGTYDISETSVELDYKGAPFEVSIEGNSTNWIAECDEEWISLKHKGRSLIIGAPLFFGTEERKGEIVIKYRGETLDTLNVCQTGFTMETMEVENTGRTITYEFPTGDIEEITCDSTWIEVRHAFNEITVNVAENNYLEPREGFIEVTINGESHRLIKLTQSETPLTLDDLMLAEVPAGAYYHGAQAYDSESIGYDPEATSIESPVHRVTLDAFKIGKYEVSQKLWQLVMGYNNSYRKDNDLPVTNVTYNEILTFLEKLRSHLNIQFRLPTEWEWEYAAKEGKSADYTLYSGSDDIESVAWYYTNSFKMLNYSGMKVANSLGIFDMTGNVMELCDGYYTQYTSEEKTNPRVESGSLRVTRGGGWNSQRTNCRTTYRFCINDDSSEDNIGFRIVMPAQ